MRKKMMVLAMVVVAVLGLSMATLLTGGLSDEQLVQEFIQALPGAPWKTVNEVAGTVSLNIPSDEGLWPFFKKYLPQGLHDLGSIKALVSLLLKHGFEKVASSPGGDVTLEGPYDPPAVGGDPSDGDGSGENPGGGDPSSGNPGPGSGDSDSDDDGEEQWVDDGQTHTLPETELQQIFGVLAVLLVVVVLPVLVVLGLAKRKMGRGRLVPVG